MERRLGKSYRLVIVAGIIFLSAGLVVRALQDPEQALLKKCIDEKVKPSLLKKFAAHGAEDFITSHLAATPIIGQPEDQTGERIRTNFGPALRGEELVGTVDDLSKTKKYRIYTIEYYLQEDAKDGGLTLRLIIDRESKSVVFVYHLPQG